MRTPVYAIIDLNTRTSARYEISEQLFRNYIGGKTLGARLLYDLTPAGVDPLGRPRAPRRFSLTAPGDPIRWAQRFEAPWQVLPRAVGSRVRGRFAGLSLGVDPKRLRGVTVLPAGTWEVARGIHEVGAPLAGPSAHAGVMTPGTGAFRALTEVVGAPP